MFCIFASVIIKFDREMCKYKDTTLGIKKLDFRSTFGRLLPKGRKNGRVATEENRNVKVAQILGHSKDLITLSLSLSLSLMR